VVDHQISPKFDEEIQLRLSVAQSNVEQSREAMNVVMAKLGECEAEFNQIADQLLNEVLRPALQKFAGYFDNAQLEDEMLGYSVCCPRSVHGEAGSRAFVPLSGYISNPHVTVAGLSSDMSMDRREAFQERMKTT
jgi:hypothetical protein